MKNHVKPSASGAKSRMSRDDDALRWRVFDLVCENWTDDLVGVAGDAFKDILSDTVVDKLLRALVKFDSGFWLDQLARTCFNLPDKDWEGEDWEGLLGEITTSVRKNANSRKAPPKKKAKRS